MLSSQVNHYYSPIDLNATNLISTLDLTSDYVDVKERAPLNIITVVDRSGSMGGYGGGLDMVKDTLQFMVSQLQEQDRLSVVTFDDEINTVIENTFLTPANKIETVRKIKGITVGGCTNLCGGVLEGIKILSNQKLPDNSVNCIIVLTDGFANRGITLADEIADNALGCLSKCAYNSRIYMMGFGKNHNEDLLNTISKRAEGQYYFIENKDAIPTSFSEILGGLMSVIAQNITLQFKTHHSVKLLSDYSQKETKVNLGDLYLGEEKNIVFSTQLPTVNGEGEDNFMVLLLEYYDVLNKEFVTRDVKTSVLREKDAKMVVNKKVDIHFNRIKVATEIARANKMVKENLAAAKEIITTEIDRLSKSVTVNDPLCQALMNDLLDCQKLLNNYHTEKANVSKRMYKCVGKHGRQRAVTTGYQDDYLYCNATQQEMKKKVTTYFASASTK